MGPGGVDVVYPVSFETLAEKFKALPIQTFGHDRGRHVTPSSNVRRYVVLLDTALEQFIVTRVTHTPSGVQKRYHTHSIVRLACDTALCYTCAGRDQSPSRYVEYRQAC